jgi:proteasome lid subunit RPN8/RPN11
MTKQCGKQEQPTVFIQGEVLRKIRQHARSSLKTEICGVLIGQDRPNRIEIQACISGANAEEAGAHVTFTQDTWEHIYQVKDKEYPHLRIVGWYHSHPGFGVFLSDHDAFIHRNFFSSPGQVAWVFDPYSDEEGCFGWAHEILERISRITVIDERGGERVQESGRNEPSPVVDFLPKAESGFSPVASHSSYREEHGENPLLRLATNVFSYLAVLLVGFLLAWYFFPRVAVVPVPVDPRTGKPIADYTMEAVPKASEQPGNSADHTGEKGAHSTKEKDGQRRE